MSILDIDITTISGDAYVRQYIKDNYKLYDNVLLGEPANIVIEDRKVTVRAYMRLINTNLTSLELPDSYKWSKVYGSLDISGANIINFKGGPEEVTGNLVCSQCKKLVGLTGAPKRVGGYMNLRNCTSLNSLWGMPNYIASFLDIGGCTSLNSLDGLVGSNKFQIYTSGTKLEKSEINRYKYNRLFDFIRGKPIDFYD